MEDGDDRGVMGAGVDRMAIFLFRRHLIPSCNVGAIRKRKRIPE